MAFAKAAPRVIRGAACMRGRSFLMHELQLDPQQEHDALYRALCIFREHWEERRIAQAVFAFCEAVERANEAVRVLEGQADQGKEYRFQVIGLKLLLTAARHQLELIQQAMVEAIEERLGAEGPEDRVLDPVFSPGMIISCPRCEQGLYKVTRSATRNELALDGGEILTPLNLTIPTRDEWVSLACPFCGARLFNDGRIRTLQDGWR
jgi:hypothetical protein